ncbi:hypothetical protein DAPPUDRAFT_231290 [Daphnia pulex]|uniref:Cytochrome c oxidase subunit 7C, mitochondrial n=1 Tax=Daphnia pulex TaxID=6669 RepID=E9H1K4_DAPPU|nr:hypothetical protein DAPPUDRAFT_231290 [Daphnia pulex]|eukprot:EFX74371.1 hypothetical protein DAPPUDRAFT_231290 [Daphnia pulex]
MSSLRNGVMQVRNIMTSAARQSGIPGGLPASSLPFSVKNRYALTVGFILFFGSGLAAPFWLVRHQLLKK